MNYVSTRKLNKDAEGNTSAFVIKNGLAPDGGLYVPETLPTLDQKTIESLVGLSYPERAAYILSLFLTDYTKEELLNAAEAAYSKEKFNGTRAPRSGRRRACICRGIRSRRGVRSPAESPDCPVPWR